MKKITSVFLFFALLFSAAVSAQTVAQSKLDCTNSHCTSKDLAIVDLFVDLPACATCSGGTVTAPLKMTIHNGTKSLRASFALYGTLSAGATINGFSGKIFICVGAITVKSDQDVGAGLGNQTFTVGTISFSCGQALTLTNNLLAWTDASGTTAERCATFANATQCKDIEPKCGDAPTITIRQPLSAETSATESCDNSASGSVTVTPHGGKAPYDITIDGTTTNNVLTATKSPLGGGSKSWSVTDDAGCTTSGTQTVGTKACCVTPPAPAVCQTPADICGDGTGSITLSGLQANAYYTVTQPNGYDETQQATGGVTTLTFTGITPGIGFTAHGEDRSSEPFCIGANATCADVTGTCAASAARPSNVVTESIRLEDSRTKVLAAPNPFNDRVKFSLESAVSGQGSLELYNMHGQKVKTVFQGYIEKGRAQTIEYSVPGTQRTGLIYIFRVGNQKTTGKLIGLK